MDYVAYHSCHFPFNKWNFVFRIVNQRLNKWLYLTQQSTVVWLKLSTVHIKFKIACYGALLANSLCANARTTACYGPQILE